MGTSVIAAGVRDNLSPSLGSARVDVLCAGFTALDLLITDSLQNHRAGGTAANVAAGLAWLGRQAGLVARLGNDVPGSLLRGDLAGSGVDVVGVDLEPTLTTPVVVHRVASNGAHDFLFSCPECRRAFPRHRPPGVEDALRHWSRLRPRVFFYDRASVASVRVAEETRRDGGIVVFEPNTVGRASLTTEAVRSAHILKISEQRASAFGDFLRNEELRQIKIITNASRGLLWRLGPGDWKVESAFGVPHVVDSGGAGDWTTAGLLTALLIEFDSRRPNHNLVELLFEERVMQRSIRFGQALAAVSVGYLGARGMSDSDKRSNVLRRVAELVDIPKLLPRRPGKPLSTRIADGCMACFGPLPAAVT